MHNRNEVVHDDPHFRPGSPSALQLARQVNRPRRIEENQHIMGFEFNALRRWPTKRAQEPQGVVRAMDCAAQ